MFAITRTLMIVTICITLLGTTSLATQPKQANIPYIDNWNDRPHYTPLPGWSRIATEYTDLFFGNTAEGAYLPLRGDFSTKNSSGEIVPAFGAPSYLGRPGWKYGDNGEGLTCIGAVLGATLAGHNMRQDYGKDWFKMCEYYYSQVTAKDGKQYGYVCNDAAAANSTGSWWYDLAPASLFFQLGCLYDDATYNAKMRDTADTMLQILPLYRDNWRHTGFDLKQWQIKDSEWREPDAAIGIAYIEYLSYKKFGDKKYLNAATECMQQMQNYYANPYYELLGSYGPYIAARMNAEDGAALNTGKFLDYILTNSSDSRPGWGIINEQWGKYPAYGLCGSTTDSDGYAFSMNTFATAGAVAPVARYAPEYSRAIGKWLTAIAWNAAIFYPDGLPAEHQEYYNWSKQTGISCIAYEGTRNKGRTQPFATGDHEHYYSLYSSWGAGYMAALYAPTDTAGIVRIDLLKTDYLRGNAYPTYLYYNPHQRTERVTIDVGRQRADIYDAVSKQFLIRGALGKQALTLAADSAAQIVLVPSNQRIHNDGNKLLAGNTVIDYNRVAALPKTDSANSIRWSAWSGWNNAAEWLPGCNATATRAGNVLRFTNVIDTWGIMERQTTQDLDANPRVKINLATVSPGAKWALKVDDGKQSYYLQGDNSRKGEFTFNIRALTGWSGAHTFKYQVFPLGGPGCYIEIDNWQTGSLAE